MDPPPFVRPAEGGAEIHALVQPHALWAALGGIHGGALKVKVRRRRPTVRQTGR